MFRSRKHPECAANIDAIIRFPGGRLYVFEAKTTISQNFDAWAAGKIPGSYIPQMRQYPAVLDDSRILGTYIGCLFTVDYSFNDFYLGSDANAGQFVSRFMERDQHLEENQLAAEAEFFQSYVVAGKEPPFEGKVEKEIEALALLCGSADKKAGTVPLDEDFREAIEEYLNLQEERKAAEKTAAEYKEAMGFLSLRMIQQLGSSVEGRLPTGLANEYYEVRYAPRSKTSVNYDVLQAKYPEAYQECVSKDPCASRVFSIKVKTEKAQKKAA